ncbi:AraC family transcriptional regulator [Leptolyngbya sp. FACHB-261]|uniref:helix-turn-helix domain-containing protein n=1 Tax=Leptolyngbya sp. FACHB-261 TaxID=2692806 RepID=UPI0016829B18|nr:AraC family transcriptional regulator [Leptolyngbya sp. FACHB-261]MBD2105284.1 helix-turn-helix transcriptional regulator [Leptolyngbya sp. FACHB-261]
MNTQKRPKKQTSTVRVCHPDQFVGLELKQGTTKTKPSAPHLHEAYQISLITAGATIFRYRHSQQVAPAHSLMAIVPGEVHENISIGARTFANIYAEPKFLQQLGLLKQSEQLPYVCEAVIHDLTALTLFSAILQSYSEPSSLIEREIRLMQAFTHLFTHYTDKNLIGTKVGQEHRAVKFVKDFMRERYAEEVTLSELSTLTGLHKNYLLNVFTKEVGISPHRYLMNIRISQAKRLIKQGRPISEVATMTGFSDQSHLTREFQKHSLVTPGAYCHKVSKSLFCSRRSTKN